MKSETMMLLYQDVLARQLVGRDRKRRWAQAVLSELLNGETLESAGLALTLTRKGR
jgi:hypothetical protein